MHIALGFDVQKVRKILKSDWKPAWLGTVSLLALPWLSDLWAVPQAAATRQVSGTDTPRSGSVTVWLMLCPAGRSCDLPESISTAARRTL